MTEYNIKRLALVLAVQAEIEGMKARNRQNNISAITPDLPTYGDDDFWRKAEELRELAYKHDHQL